MAYTYVFNKNSCMYNQVCSLYNSENCNDACIRYMEFDFLLKSSNLPKKLYYPAKLYPDNCDLQNFELLADLKDDILGFVEDATNLFICSSICGNGKTSWAVKLLLKYFDAVWNGNGFVPRGLFIHVPTFLYDAKNYITGKEVTDYSSIYYYAQAVDLVVWDDIAINKLSVYDQTLLTSLLDRRQNNNKANIFTSNIVPKNLDLNVGQRLVSRILSGLCVELKGHDMRRARNGNASDFK